MVLVQLDAELDLLETALDAAEAGRSTLLLAEGAVGCGKSEFLETAAVRAACRGALVLRAFGDETERQRPLGVLGQLAHGARTAGAELPLPRDPETAGHLEHRQAFAAGVHRLTVHNPVVVCVDDLHHVDDLSRRHLLHLVRGSRMARLLLVYTTPLPTGGGDPLLGTDLLRQPHLVRVRLERLRRDAVRVLLGGRAGADADRMHRTSGGNPLLLRALLQDPRCRPAGHYAQALLACLRRCGPDAGQLAAAVAVLDGHGGPGLAAELAGGPGTAARATAALTAAGLLDGARLCHPAARDAVLADLDPGDRRTLQRRAARLAHAAGAPAPVVAAQLIGARHTAEDWVLPVLRSAAGQFLADGAPELAAACLELAHEAGPDEAHRADVRIRLATVAARTDPAAAETHLASPLEAARAGTGERSWLGALARTLAAQGRVEESAEVLTRLGRRPAAAPASDDRRPDPLDGLSAFPRWAAAEPERPAHPSAAQRPVREGVHPAALWAVPDRDREPGAAHAAELYLRGAALTDDTVTPVVQALRVVLHAGGAEQALPWCEAFAARAEQRGAGGWYAAFAGLLARARLRLGDLDAAAGAAAGALAAVPERGGSALLCGVAGTLVRAYTAMGRLDEAAGVLSRPVPDSLAGSVHGLAYLRARGQHALATSRFHAALGDFLDVGRRTKAWSLDQPRVLPWRLDVAAALLRLGETHQADRFLADQMATRDAHDPWLRGMTLRLRAELCDPRERQDVLATAVDELRRSGDRYQLALALADFSEALLALGEPARGGMVGRRAWHLARECGADTLCERILPGHVQEAAAAADDGQPSGADLVATLSESEKRVAMLAVYGHTNREIALKLYITVSTVEQHLTRVYRKLDISGRAELPVDLQLAAAEFA
ncbi:hypothetical protein SRB5_42660 [Streptomyces sp. RB5]|uniref:HTH luxR-type domain-containing protein n=1 Tax=Streptomyces smaragdinus TaxID=2585196 RepID=A0A7K0CKS4_9ACTN|nr:AAA family ATPase [Streptomyces smaragdinus]MQY14105.1 hypothetical protein [Streptomyces smaragdinus]